MITMVAAGNILILVCSGKFSPSDIMQMIMLAMCVKVSQAKVNMQCEHVKKKVFTIIVIKY